MHSEIKLLSVNQLLNSPQPSADPTIRLPAAATEAAKGGSVSLWPESLNLGTSLSSVSGDLPCRWVIIRVTSKTLISGADKKILLYTTAFCWSNHQSKFMKHKSRSLINSQQLVLNGGITACTGLIGNLDQTFQSFLISGKSLKWHCLCPVSGTQLVAPNSHLRQVSRQNESDTAAVSSPPTTPAHSSPDWASKVSHRSQPLNNCQPGWSESLQNSTQMSEIK